MITNLQELLVWVKKWVWRERQVVVYPPRCCARRVASILRPLNLRCISWLAITRARTLLLNAMLIVCPLRRLRSSALQLQGED